MVESSRSAIVPIGRLAPSPTGFLHLGHARSFLLAWWQARSRGGRIVLRLEDLDADRVKPGMAEQAIADLEWLGLDWDGEVVVQSRGKHRLDAAVASLIERGLAYPCVCTRAEIAASQSAPHADAGEPRYPGTCRDRFPSIEEAERVSGRSPAVRFRVAPGRVRIDDGFAGTTEFDVEREVGDFPVARKAGAAAYQLAVVVDDAHAGVTEVVRGDDLLSSAARQLLVQRALALPHPRWFHVPLVVDEGGRRLAKRTDALALHRLRERGIEPERVVAWIANRSGIEVGSTASARECAARFDLARVPRTPVVCGPREHAQLGLA
ncbi:MAG: tRNA glutamyl-Q(34) synthetase GluQRS [Planctomycetota bacterium]